MKPISNGIDFVAETISINGMGIKTGYPELDDRMRGLTKGELTVLAARPSAGKTAMMVNMALNIAQEHAVGIFSLEMSETQLIERMISNKMEVPLQQLKLAIVKPDKNTIADIGNLKLWINDESGINTKKMYDIYMEAKVNFDVLFVDYLQLIRDSASRLKRYEEVDVICQNLRYLAKKKDMAVVLVAQLNRAVEQRENHKPRLADLRDSGSIEQIADKVLFIYRPAYYKLFDKSDSSAIDDGEAHIIIAKNRNGALGDIPVVWLKETMQFKPCNFTLGGDEF